MAFACKQDPVDSREGDVVLLQQDTAVERILNVGRAESLADNRGKMEEILALQEYEPAEIMSDISQNRDLFLLNLVTGSNELHQGDVGAPDGVDIRDSAAQE